MSTIVPEFVSLDGYIGLLLQEDGYFLLTEEEVVSECNPIFDKFAVGDESGCERFRRLRLLGYV